MQRFPIVKVGDLGHRGFTNVVKEKVLEREILKLSIGKRSRILTVRNKIRAVFDYLKVSRREQNRFIRVVSELARNTIQYAGKGKLSLSVTYHSKRWKIGFLLSDRGPGIARLNEIVQGTYRFPTGKGLGILSAKRLLDDFKIDSTLGQGTEARGSLWVEVRRSKKGGDRLYRNVLQQPAIAFLPRLSLSG